MTERLQEMYSFGVKRTELFYSTVLSGRTGANVYVKREDLQENKSFKIRGAMNNMLAKIEEDREGDRIFACASTGNHAQGVAMACAKMRKKGIIFMPKIASQVKIDKTKHFGGEFVEIKLVGDNFDECLAIAEQEVKENGYCFIHPYDDVNTIAGQATLMEEVKAQLEEKGEKCDLVFSPVGGGGLISGIINVVEKYNMNTKVVGGQTELCHPLTKSLENGENIESDIAKKEVITDGSLVKKLGTLTWDIINNSYKNGGFSVEVLKNDNVLYCMGLAKTEHNIDVEGAGGLSFAGFLQYAKTHNVKGKNVVLVNSGGNVLQEIQQKAVDFYKNNSGTNFELQMSFKCVL